jgi:hypothetical protein
MLIDAELETLPECDPLPESDAVPIEGVGASVAVLGVLEVETVADTSGVSDSIIVTVCVTE